MSETPDDHTKREQLRIDAERLGAELKAEVAAHVDQFLDELGARIGD